MFNPTDEELYELIKDEMTLEEAYKIKKESFLRNMNHEEYSEEDALKYGKAALILEHHGVLKAYKDKLYNNLCEDDNGKYYYSTELDT